MIMIKYLWDVLFRFNVEIHLEIYSSWISCIGEWPESWYNNVLLGWSLPDINQAIVNSEIDQVKSPGSHYVKVKIPSEKDELIHLTKSMADHQRYQILLSSNSYYDEHWSQLMYQFFQLFSIHLFVWTSLKVLFRIMISLKNLMNKRNFSV